MKTFLIIIILFAIVIYFGIRHQKQIRKKFIEMGINPDTAVKIGEYVTGHPDLIKKMPLAFVKYNNDIAFFEWNSALQPGIKAKIPVADITNILVEDKTTMEKRITATRLLLVGIFALAWRKKNKNPLAYITIQWNDGKFDHDTVFEFKNIEEANKVYGELVKAAR